MSSGLGGFWTPKCWETLSSISVFQGIRSTLFYVHASLIIYRICLHKMKTEWVNEWKSLSCVLTICDPMDYTVHGSPGQNTEVDSCSLLQGIFPTQGSNPGLPCCRWILYQLSYQGSPRILEWVEPGSPALQADSLPAELYGKPPMKTDVFLIR